MKTVRGRIDANPDSEEKPKNEKRKIRARPVQHHKQSSQPSQSASKQISQPKDRQANNQQATRRPSPQHGNPASQPSSRPVRRSQPTESQLQQSSSHSISHRANSVEGTVAAGPFAPNSAVINFCTRLTISGSIPVVNKLSI